MKNDCKKHLKFDSDGQLIFCVCHGNLENNIKFYIRFCYAL